MKPPSARKRLRTIALALTAVGGVAAFAWWWQRRGDLLRVAQPVAATKAWSLFPVLVTPPGLRMMTGGDYQWLDPSHLLHGTGVVPLQQIGSGYHNPAPTKREQLWLLNVDTGREEQLKALRGLINGCDIALATFSPSRDGKRVAWADKDGSHLAALDGSGHRQIEWYRSYLNGDGWVQCCPDSDELIAWNWVYGAGRGMSLVPISPAGQPQQLALTTVAYRFGVPTVISGRRVAIVSWPHNWAGQQPRIRVFDMTPQPPAEQRYQAPFPQGVKPYGAAVCSSDGKIAWLTISDADSITAWLMSRLFHSRGVPVASLWISRLDGTQLRRVGRMGLALPEKELPACFLRWVPGGKAVSFVYKDQLWVAPVE